MKLDSYLDKIEKSKVDIEKIKLTEKKYNISLLEKEKKILCAIETLTNIDGKEINIFPLDYINEFTYKDFGIDFNVLRLLPVLDLHDGCYGCYDIQNKKWCVYSISDNLKYSFFVDYMEFIKKIK